VEGPSVPVNIFRELFLAVVFAERASLSARPMAFLFPLTGGDFGGFCPGIGNLRLSDFET
jgi:hypothetical protein